MQKVLNNIYPPVMKIFVSFRERQMPSQNLQKNEAAKKNKKTIRFGLKTALYYASQIRFPEYKVIT